ncbi:hypothetical protein CEXT_557841 [Caerostris extrusa]|uniref:Uncharacterized protein n=1 Tax=Caerostris extrusa TaxID=172846 RepID=A0AAV4PY98_CAEEX|nr:hypothetical protein CEXT_557841 [Caerostris extrusa]
MCRPIPFCDRKAVRPPSSHWPLLRDTHEHQLRQAGHCLLFYCVHFCRFSFQSAAYIPDEQRLFRGRMRTAISTDPKRAHNQDRYTKLSRRED